MDKHPIGIILKSNAIKDIRFSISKDHWKDSPSVFSTLPDVVVGCIDKWGGQSKSDNKIDVSWESDGTSSVEFLAVLLRPSLGFKLLPYLNGKSAPRAKGANAKREYAVATTTGPYAQPAEQAEREEVEVSCLRLPCLRACAPLVPLLTCVSACARGCVCCSLPASAIRCCALAGSVHGLGRSRVCADLGCAWATGNPRGLA